MRTRAWILGLMIAAPLTAWAAPYRIEWEAQIGGERPLKGFVLVEEGETGTASAEDATIKVLPTRTSRGAIDIKAVVLQKTPQGELVEVLTKSGLITLLNHPVEVTQTRPGVASSIRLKLVPKAR